jgi:hypothetical protein
MSGFGLRLELHGAPLAALLTAALPAHERFNRMVD